MAWLWAYAASVIVDPSPGGRITSALTGRAEGAGREGQQKGHADQSRPPQHERQLTPLHDPVAQHPDAFDLQLDDVARPEASGRPRAPGCSLGPPSRTRSRHPAAGPGVLRAAAARSSSQSKCIPPVRDSVRTSPLTRATARMSRSAGSSSTDTRTGPSEVAKSLPLAWPEPDLHLASLKVTGRPVVHDREPLGPAVGADHAGQLQLVVQRRGVRRLGDVVPVAGTRPRVGEVEHRDLDTRPPAPPGRGCAGRPERAPRRP